MAVDSARDHRQLRVIEGIYGQAVDGAVGAHRAVDEASRRHEGQPWVAGLLEEHLDVRQRSQGPAGFMDAASTRHVAGHGQHGCDDGDAKHVGRCGHGALPLGGVGAHVAQVNAAMMRRPDRFAK
jgi:hypothetical protein